MQQRVVGGPIAVIALLFGLGVGRCVAADSAWDGMAASPVWGDFQFGWAEVQRKTQAMAEIDKVNTFWRLEAGLRLNRDWLVGAGTEHISLSSLDKFSQLYGTVLFIPGRGPWLFQAGLGQAKFSGRYPFAFGPPLEENHKGLALNLGVGRDWTGGIDDVHFGVRLGYEFAQLGSASTGPGSFNHSRLSLAGSMSFY